MKRCHGEPLKVAEEWDDMIRDVLYIHIYQTAVVTMNWREWR